MTPKLLLSLTFLSLAARAQQPAYSIPSWSLGSSAQIRFNGSTAYILATNQQQALLVAETNGGFLSSVATLNTSAAPVSAFALGPNGSVYVFGSSLTIYNANLAVTQQANLDFPGVPTDMGVSAESARRPQLPGGCERRLSPTRREYLLQGRCGGG